MVAIGNGERRSEVAIVGCEGMTGHAIAFGVDRLPHSTFMHVDGKGQPPTSDNLHQGQAVLSLRVDGGGWWADGLHDA